MTLEDYFPKLAQSGYRITSPRSVAYNCVAWAAGEQDAWWWPDPMNVAYWPSQAPREETVQAFIKAFETLGFVACADDRLEAGFVKVAVYAREGVPTHTARQVNEGLWTSKLGRGEDIEHTLEGLLGSLYGSVVQLLKRPAKS